MLGLDPGAGQADIKRAYRRRALKEHPDVNKAPDAKERWQELSQAYDILSDPEKRRLWEVAKRGSSTGAGGQRRRPSGGGAAGYGRSSAEMPKGPRQAALDAEYDPGGDSFGAIFGDFLEGLGREVGGETGTLGKARKVGGYVLEELLDFLEGSNRRAKTGAAGYDDWDGTRPAEELKFAREELSTLQALEETLRAESDTWQGHAEACRASGLRVGELEAMRKAFDAKERRSNIRRRVVRAEERVEYLEKVLFEVERKRQARAEGPAAAAGDAPLDYPGVYTILHDGTKVAPTRELSDTIVAELKKGEAVRVLEVVSSPALRRVRGRLEKPPGWISLLNTETGYRWAAREGAAQSSGSGGPSRQAAAPPPPRPAFDADEALRELKSRRGLG